MNRLVTSKQQHTYPHHIFSDTYLWSFAHTHHDYLRLSGYLFFKNRLLPFDLSMPAYHSQKLLKSFIIIFLLKFLLIFTSIVCTFIQVQYSCCSINFSLPLLQLPFDVTRFNIISTSLIHHLCTCILSSVTVSQQVTYLHLFNHTTILSICTSLYQFHIPRRLWFMMLHFYTWMPINGENCVITVDWWKLSCGRRIWFSFSI